MNDEDALGILFRNRSDRTVFPPLQVRDSFAFHRLVDAAKNSLDVEPCVDSALVVVVLRRLRWGARVEEKRDGVENCRLPGVARTDKTVQALHGHPLQP